MELLLEFHMFKLLKMVSKEFFVSFMDKFRNLLSVKLTVLSERNMEVVNFEAVYEICEKSEESEGVAFRIKFIEAILASESSFLLKLSLGKLKSLISRNSELIKWICESKALKLVLSNQNFELFNNFNPVLVLMTPSLTCEQVGFIHSFITSSQIGACVAEYLLFATKKLSKSVIITIFNSFTSGSFEEVLFATQFSDKVFETFEFNYQDFNRDYFDSLVNCDNVTYNNLGIMMISKLYHRYSINPKVTFDIIDHIHKIEKGLNIVQNARLLIDLDRMNANFKHHLSEKSALSTIAYIRAQDDSVYETREKIQFLLKYLEVYIKYSKKMEKKMFSDLFLFLKNSSNEDTFADWLEKCVIYFSPEVTEQIYSEYFLDSNDYGTWTIYTFRCFLRIYLLTNSYDRCIELKKGNFLMRLQQLLRNTDRLVELTLNCNEDIFREGCEILVNLHLKLGENLDKFRESIWKEFFLLLLRSSDGLSKHRVLRIMHSFIQPQEDTDSGVMFFLFRAGDKEQLNEVYIEQLADVRTLKKKICKKYDKKYWNTVLVCDNCRYGRYEDDVKVKFLNQSIITVEFEPDFKHLITIEKFFNTSNEIQGYLIEVLNEEKEYSKTAFEILTSIPFSQFASMDLYSNNLESLRNSRKSFYSFFFQAMIIEKIMEDSQWLVEFKANKGVDIILSTFIENNSKDIDFNKCLLSITIKFMQTFEDILSENLIKRLLQGFIYLSVSSVDVDKMLTETFILIKDYNIQFYETFSQDSVFFLDLWQKIVFFSENTQISVQFLNFFLDLSHKSSYILYQTLEYLLFLLDEHKSLPSIKNEFFIYIKKFLSVNEFQNHYKKLFTVLEHSLSLGLKTPISGILYLLKSSRFIPSDLNLRFIINSIISSDIYMKSKKVRKNFFEILVFLFDYLSLDSRIVALNSLKHEVHSLKSEFCTSSDYLYLGEFYKVRLQKSQINPYLNVIFSQLFFQNSVKKMILSSLYELDSFCFTIQRIFRKLENNSGYLMNTDKFYKLIQKDNKFSLDSPSSICKYFKNVIKSIASESLIENMPMMGQIIIENSKTKGCEHVENQEISPFMYLCIEPENNDILKSFEKIFKLETKQLECERCGSLNSIQSHRYLYKNPEILVIFIERLSDSIYSKQVPIFNRVLCEFDTVIDLKKFKHVDCNNICRYELTGIISFNSSINSFTSYCKIQGIWMQGKDDQLKIMKNNDFLKEIYGVSKQNEVNSKLNAACVLLYNKTQANVRQTRIDTWIYKSDISKNYFFLSNEFQNFAFQIFDSNSLEILKISYFYFFSFIIRLNDFSTIFKFFEKVLNKIKSEDFRHSEILLETLRDEKVIQVLIYINKNIESQMVTDVITMAIDQSRPSTCTNLLGFMLKQLKNVESPQSTPFFEILYLLCKLSPSLAVESKADLLIFDSIFSFIPMKTIPSYLIACSSLFTKTFTMDYLNILSDPSFIHLLLNSNHDFVTSIELGKLFVLVKNENISKPFIENLFKIIENKPKDFHYLIILGMLRVSKQDSLMKLIVNLLCKMMNLNRKEGKDSVNLVQVLLVAVEFNESCLEFLRKECKTGKEMEKAIDRIKNTENQIYWILKDEMKKKMKTIRDKSKKLSKDLKDLVFNKVRKILEGKEEVFTINSTTYFKHKSDKIKLVNKLTGRT